MYSNIPPELRALRQWVVSSANRIPINPRTGEWASPTDPATWGSFDEALATGYPHLGFVLTREDPYCIIDLDDKETNPASDEDKKRFQQILNHFNSYTETSTSGRGIHIVVKGALPSGVNRDHIEIYSDSRYMIFTGQVVKNLPIADGYQETLDAMYGQMKPEESIDLINVDAVVDDDYIYTMASTAENKEKFLALWQGDITGYPSPSEADLALLSILGYYTRSDEQVKRMFMATPLGNRMKDGKPRHNGDTTINYALRKIRAKQPPPIDLSMLHNGNSIALQPPPAPVAETTTISNLTVPPGLVGEIAQYVYQSAQRPVPEVALATALTLVAGIVGRSYNVSNTGLNIYVALLAKTGAGKEAAATSITRLLFAIRPRVPAATSFLGPAVFASGPALHRSLAKHPCFVSVLGEFGLLLQKMSSKNSNAADITLMRTLLDCFAKSGHTAMLMPSVYSDKEKDVEAIQAPNLTILGESTPESFYEALDERSVTSGFLPRFLVIEYFGDRPASNKNAGMQPSESLVNKLVELITISMTTAANNTCMPVLTMPDAQARMDDFDAECDTRMKGNNGDVLDNIWNRAHLKALKLAALIAVGCSPHQPVVDLGMADWAVALVRADSERLAARFAKGEVGEGDGKQQAEIQRVITEYLGAGNDFKSLGKYHTTEVLKNNGVVPMRFLQRRLYGTAAFKNDRRGAGEALNKAVQTLKDAGVLAELDSRTLRERFQYEGRAFGMYKG